jgi:hypothetical protein
MNKYSFLNFIVFVSVSVSSEPSGNIDMLSDVKSIVEQLNQDEGVLYDPESSRSDHEKNEMLLDKLNDKSTFTSSSICKFEVETTHKTICPYAGSADVRNPFTGQTVTRFGGDVVITHNKKTESSQWNVLGGSIFDPIDLNRFYPSGAPKECSFTPFYNETSTVFYRFSNGVISGSQRVYFTAEYRAYSERPEPISEVTDVRLLVCPSGGGGIF